MHIKTQTHRGPILPTGTSHLNAACHRKLSEQINNNKQTNKQGPSSRPGTSHLQPIPSQNKNTQGVLDSQ